MGRVPQSLSNKLVAVRTGSNASRLALEKEQLKPSICCCCTQKDLEYPPKKGYFVKMAVRSFALCMILFSAAGLVSSNILEDFLSKVHPECKGPVQQLTASCVSEFQSATNALGLSFPPTADELKTAGFEKFEEYANSNPPVSESCCKQSCALAFKGCGCNQDTFNALVGAIGGRGDFMARIFRQVADSCGQLSNPILFQPTMVNIEGSCSSQPTFECP
ncbi:hypothetical protein BSKO_07036 [Bryopsis sp. KO-2023]|nr:hypothetical protein BSKO_07036 [Bryopsis sp. KO-2023]